MYNSQSSVPENLRVISNINLPVSNKNEGVNINDVTGTSTTGRTWQYDPNNPDATPVLNSFLWFGNEWSCQEWVTWFYSLQTKYGYTVAKNKWLTTWETQSFWSSNYSWCKYQTEFANFLKNNSIEGQSNIISRTVTTSTESFSNILDGIKNGSVVIKWLLPVTIAALSVIALTTVYSKIKQA